MTKKVLENRQLKPQQQQQQQHSLNVRTPPLPLRPFQKTIQSQSKFAQFAHKTSIQTISYPTWPANTLQMLWWKIAYQLLRHSNVQSVRISVKITVLLFVTGSSSTTCWRLTPRLTLTDYMTAA